MTTGSGIAIAGIWLGVAAVAFSKAPLLAVFGAWVAWEVTKSIRK